MTCLWCDADAERLCDFMLGHAATGDMLFDLNGPHYTCDAPMCDAHSTKVGNVCGDDPDTIDHCPEHAAQGPLPFEDCAHDRGAAATMRRAVRAIAWRSRFQVVRPPGRLPDSPDSDR